jgi:hypothetical protein
MHITERASTSYDAEYSYKHNNTLLYSTSGTRLKVPTAFPFNEVKT